MSAQQLIGTWKLLSCTFETADGEILSPFGRNPIGLLMYDVNGYMSVHLMDPSRRHFAANHRLRGTAEEVRAAFEGYDAYSGTYEVDEAQQIVYHTSESDIYPNHVGTRRERHYKLEDNRLTLTTPPMPFIGDPMVATIVWERVGQPS